MAQRNAKSSQIGRRLHAANLVAALMIAAGSACSALGAEAQSGTVKIRVPVAMVDATLSQAAGASRLVARYESFAVIEISAARVPTGDNIEVLTEENLILLNAVRIDTTTAEAKAQQQLRGDFAGKAMHMVQFASAVQPAWMDALTATGVEIVTYIPSNSYIVYATAPQIARLQSLAAASDFIQWNAPYRAEYKIHPDALALTTDPVAAATNDVLFEIQLVKDDVANKETLAILAATRTGGVIQEYDSLNYHNIVIAMSPAMVSTIAGLADVVSIHHYVTPELNDERQNQIISGNIAGNLPSGPGYLAWLTSKGFTQAQFTSSAFAVDVSDSGIDNATTSPNHFGLYVSGVRPGTSRVVYNRLIGTPNGSSTLRGCDGHGTLNTHIVAGYNTLAGAPHTDAAGYHYGLGVCPFVLVGSSVIFDPSTYTTPNFATLQSQAYNNGARISTNSWGAAVGGAYNASAQSYDALVRDAQPAGSTVPAAGNQEMVICFSAGNSGAGANTIGSPGTAKNVLTVGASENVQAFGGADGCGTTDAEADNINDIVAFSSRGPCDDARKKPDIQAPGTHVSGGVFQQAAPGVNGLADVCYTGNGVCGGVASANFFPAGGQQWWTASSGTSHSTPAVAGAAALVRQYFINSSMSPATPAMTKAVMMNSTRYMTGVSANDTLPSNSQGMGELHLGNLFDRSAANSIFRDEVAADMFTATGQTRTFTGTIGDSSKPFRVTLAWTDAPGATAGNAYKNNLDLTVTVGANIYKGNVFTGANSVTGGVADVANNVESVFLPAGTTGAYTVTVTATNINSDGVPNVGTTLDQDFALVVYNVQNGPTNNACASAIDVSAGGTFAGTLVGATNDGTASCGSSAAQADVWYTFTAPACAGTLSVDTFGSQAVNNVDTVVSVLASCGGAELSCNDDAIGHDSQTLTNLAAGQTVKIRVSKFNTTAQLPFIMHVNYGHANDLCANALPITVGQTAWSNCLAGTDGPAENNCSFCCGDPQVNGDVWYNFVAPQTAMYIVDTVGSSFDTKLAAYSGSSCPSVADTAIACNDDAGGSLGTISRMRMNVTAGQSYKIRAGGFTTSRGAGFINITCSADFNQDGVIDFFDYLDFVNAFSSGAAEADFNGDATIDFFDYLDFVDAFSHGC